MKNIKEGREFGFTKRTYVAAALGMLALGFVAGAGMVNRYSGTLPGDIGPKARNELVFAHNELVDRALDAASEGEHKTSENYYKAAEHIAKTIGSKHLEQADAKHALKEREFAK